MARLQVAAYPRVYGRDVAFWLFTDRPDGKRDLGRAVTFETVEPDGYEPDPTFALRSEEAQSLMDALWNAGLRPALGRQSEGVTAAQGRHLEDMRMIAFAKLNITPPA